MEKIKIKQKPNRSGFTLVELVIVIAIVIILSVVSVPIYRGYIDKAKWSEAYALMGTILSAQKAYYSEHGNFLRWDDSSLRGKYSNCEEILGIDARGNKYFTLFMTGWSDSVRIRRSFSAEIIKPLEYQKENDTSLVLYYNVTKGSKYVDFPINGDNSWYN